MVLALAIPTPNRAQKKVKAFTAQPDIATMAPKMMLDQPMMGIRRNRSAAQPMGMAPSTTKAPDELAMKVMVPSLTPKVSRMSGASTEMAAIWSSSSEFRMASTTKVAAPPPMASPFFSDRPALFTPGSSSSGNMTWLASCSAWRAASSASTDAARDAALPPAPVSSGVSPEDVGSSTCSSVTVFVSPGPRLAAEDILPCGLAVVGRLPWEPQ